MKKYTYKDSNIEWLGDIPVHWSYDKLYRICASMGSGGTPKSTNQSYYGGNIFWIQSGDLNDSYVSETKKMINEDALNNSSAKIFPKGTLLVAMYGATIGKLGIMEMDAATNQACCSLQLSSKIISKYAFYLMLDARDYLITQAYGGGQPNISQETLKQLHLYYPPLQEQKAIAEYLDKATVKLDRIIAIKQEQLLKMEDYYDSKIHEYITKGNNNTKLIESGIYWQGEVPKHWKKEKLFRLADKMGSGGTPKSTNQDYYGGEIDWIQSGDLNDWIVSTTKKTITEEALNNSSAKMFKKGTLLIAMYGATIGKLGVMGMDAATNQACCAIQVGSKLNSDFLFYLLYDMRKYLISQGYGGGQPNISQETLKQQYFYHPAKTEQIEIVNQINDFRSKQEVIRNNVKSQIKTLQVYRKSLIHECITGKKQITTAIKN